MGSAWSDMATNNDTAHAPAECSNRGACDRATGECRCSSGFEGHACERCECLPRATAHPGGRRGTLLTCLVCSVVPR